MQISIASMNFEQVPSILPLEFCEILSTYFEIKSEQDLIDSKNFGIFLPFVEESHFQSTNRPTD